MKTLILRPLSEALKNWYLPLIVGFLFIGAAIAAFVSPASSYLVLAMLFSLGFLFSGIFEILFSVANRKQLDNWGWYLVFGIVTLVIGALLLINPVLSMGVLALYVGFTILFRSISTFSFALDVKRYGSANWGWLLVLGILGAIFAIILIWNPVFAGMTIVFWTGLAFLLSGVFSIFFSMQLRKLHKHSEKISSEWKERYNALQNDLRKEQF
ncbi:MAG: DUF308 domain-containing protein [Cyclobacteriaceae bacterium]|nr:DUF308 domain-containing protein [Cyclobacteriaceae bacterium]